MNDQTKTCPSKEAGDIKFGGHVVTLIDLLGQQSKLAEWDSLPETKQEEQKFIDAIRQSFGKVKLMRDQYEKNVRITLEAMQLPESVTKSYADGGRLYQEFADKSLKFMHFSDTIVIYSPLVNQFGHINAGTVITHMYICGCLVLAGLNQGTVFRGAIELGMAGQIDEAGIYGPVLANVHHLESKVAEYPRIMVGDKLNEYLATQSIDPGTSAPSRANRDIAGICMSLLGNDLDKKRILDYMGDGFADLSTKKDDWDMLRTGACNFVERERNRFKQAGDQKLAERYDLMCAYHASRMTSS